MQPRITTRVFEQRIQGTAPGRLQHYRPLQQREHHRATPIREEDDEDDDDGLQEPRGRSEAGDCQDRGGALRQGDGGQGRRRLHVRKQQGRRFLVDKAGSSGWNVKLPVLHIRDETRCVLDSTRARVNREVCITRRAQPLLSLKRIDGDTISRPPNP